MKTEINNVNSPEGEFLGMVMDGAITLPATDVPEPFVDVDDIAASGLWKVAA